MVINGQCIRHYHMWITIRDGLEWMINSKKWIQMSQLHTCLMSVMRIICWEYTTQFDISMQPRSRRRHSCLAYGALSVTGAGLSHQRSLTCIHTWSWSTSMFRWTSVQRKFRSQTSDNMDKWKSRGGKSQRGEKKKRERDSLCFFKWFVAPEGRKVGSLERRVRSQPARLEMKSCTPLWREARLEVKSVKNWRSRTTFGMEMSKKSTPLWREAHFEVKMHKTPQCRSAFGSWHLEKVHADVARSTVPSQNVRSTPFSDHFWNGDVEKVRAVVARSTFPSQNAQNTSVSERFW